MTAIFNEQHKPVRAIGVVENITQHKEIEYAYLKEETYRRALLADTLFYDNHPAGRDHGYPLEINARELMEHLCHSYDQYLRWRESKISTEKITRSFWKPFPGKTSRQLCRRYPGMQIRIPPPDQFWKTYWVEATAHMMKDPVSGDIRCLLYLHDIDAAKRERLILENASRLDPLTELYNKGAA